jgi:hypothetical protein
MRTILLLMFPLLVIGCASKKPASIPQYTGITTEATAVSGNLTKVREGGEGVRSHIRTSRQLLDQLDQKAAALLGNP